MTEKLRVKVSLVIADDDAEKVRDYIGSLDHEAVGSIQPGEGFREGLCRLDWFMVLADRETELLHVRLHKLGAYAVNIMTSPVPSYCTQNGGHCETCSLNNYGLDCRNNPIECSVF